MYSCVLSLHWSFCFCSMGTFIFVWMWVTRYPYNMKDTSLYHVSVLLFLSVYPQIICFSQEAATYNTSQLDIHCVYHVMLLTIWVKLDILCFYCYLSSQVCLSPDLISRPHQVKCTESFTFPGCSCTYICSFVLIVYRFYLP